MLKIINPYPGFENGFYRPYIENESNLFFGRDKDISALKLKLRQKKLVSLIAEPKMGKTSLLRAGLIPNLRNNSFDGFNGNEWKCMYMMPELKPIHSIAKAFVSPSNKLSDKIKPSMEEEVYSQLLKNDYGLIRVAERIIGDREINILLVIDDFYDIFQPEVDPRERQKFLKLLYMVYQDKNIPLYIVATFNKENFKDDKMKQDPKLYKGLGMGMHKMKFLDNQGLERAINEPAKMSNCMVANDLSNEMMLMLLQDNDQLRKLQLLMSRTWLEWKRSHKDKTITKAHYFRATGQKSKAVAKGLMKGGKISVDHLETLAMESAKADNTEMAKNDYQKLSEEHKNLFKRIIPHLIDNESASLKSIEVDRKRAGEILGITMEELGILVTQIPTILAMDRKKLSINDITIFDKWDEIKDWIRNNNTLKLKFEQVADAAILHYIDGIDLKSVISKQQYKDLFKYIDVSMITASWARAQHEQYELGLDFIQKLQEVYGVVDVVQGSKVKKKMTFGSSKSAKKGPSKASEEMDDDKLEALKILGMTEETSSQDQVVQEDNNSVSDKGSQAPKVTEPSTADEGEVDEEEAIKRLLAKSDEPEVSQAESELEESLEAAADVPAAKPKVSLKPKTKIVLKSKENKEKPASGSRIQVKPKIVIKKK